MKVVLVFAALCVVAWAIPTPQRKYQVDDPLVLNKQKDVLMLTHYINQPSYYKEIVEIGNTFKFEDHFDYWPHMKYPQQFLHMYEYGFLPQGEMFSIFNARHLKQAIALFNVFYYAKTYDNFYTVAAWARNHVNAGMYVYALSVAVIHRDDMFGVVLPPIYEIMPHYFFNEEVIYKAQQYKQHYWGTYENQEMITDNSYKGYTLQANYSGWYMNVHPEQSMTYFTEDVGLNAYYYYYNLHYPFWMEGEEFGLNKERRGEQYYYVHQQLLARYYLERLSNKMGEIPHFSYDYSLETGYYPSLSYPNGMPFPQRPNHAELYYHGIHGQQSYPWYGNYSDNYQHVKDYERRLRDAIDGGYVFTETGRMLKIYEKNGFEMIGNIVENNPDSVHERYYGDLQTAMRQLLGYSYFPLSSDMIAPSAMEHFETSLRDPMFYQMYKKIMHYFHEYKNHLPTYTAKELLFQGVSIQNVEIDHLITYFDYFYTDLSNAVYVNEKEFNEDSFQIRARQERLNHKPFTYKMNVAADHPTQAFVKVFIGPKYDEYGREMQLSENNYNFVEFDRFYFSLQPGMNVIERSSQQSFFGADKTSYYDMYKHVMQADYHLDASEYFWAMPNRFLLPKGTTGGQTYQFFFFIAPYHGEPVTEMYPMLGTGSFYMDNHYPLGYPLDQPIENEWEFNVPNAYFKDVTIYHKILSAQQTKHNEAY